MANKSDLPEGWAMPEYMAKRVSDSVKKKPESPEDKLQKALDEVARDIALIEPNPKDWAWWVGYLLEQMEIQAQKRGQNNQYEFALEVFEESLQNRIKGGRW
jgi:hypothetical protein